MKKEHMEKLTLESIKSEITAKLFHIPGYILFAVTSAIFLWFANILKGTGDTSAAVTSYMVGIYILSAISALSLFGLLISDILDVLAIKKGKITIKKDKLVDILVDKNRKAHVFYFDFATCIPKGKTMVNLYCRISEDRKYYKWSQKYCMKGENIQNSSEIGDEFYLVFLRRKNPLLIYNTKFFYIEGE